MQYPSLFWPIPSFLSDAPQRSSVRNQLQVHCACFAISAACANHTCGLGRDAKRGTTVRCAPRLLCWSCKRRHQCTSLPLYGSVMVNTWSKAWPTHGTSIHRKCTTLTYDSCSFSLVHGAIATPSHLPSAARILQQALLLRAFIIVVTIPQIVIINVVPHILRSVQPRSRAARPPSSMNPNTNRDASDNGYHPHEKHYRDDNPHRHTVVGGLGVDHMWRAGGRC